MLVWIAQCQGHSQWLLESSSLHSGKYGPAVRRIRLSDLPVDRDGMRRNFVKCGSMPLSRAFKPHSPKLPWSGSARRNVRRSRNLLHLSGFLNQEHFFFKFFRSVPGALAPSSPRGASFSESALALSHGGVEKGMSRAGLLREGAKV